jgi:hypothetical protein
MLPLGTAVPHRRQRDRQIRESMQPSGLMLLCLGTALHKWEIKHLQKATKSPPGTAWQKRGSKQLNLCKNKGSAMSDILV